MLNVMKTIDALLEVYTGKEPDLLQMACKAKALQRIDAIDMNCGMNYTSFPLFQKMSPYSRLRHSIGVAMIIDHFTHDDEMMLAGLFHDIATPVFSHVIDFLNGDYEKQESTEERTTDMIRNDPFLLELLHSHNIPLQAVDDYHRYPIADNDTPRLSADRLEYSLSNMVNYGFAKAEDAVSYYKNLVVTENEECIEEIAFQDAEIAAAFTRHVLQCSHIYSSDYDRYAMDKLASIVKEAIKRHVITVDDLYQDSEEQCIEKLCKDPLINQAWLSFRQLKHVVRCPAGTKRSRVIPAKKRWIDPLVKGKGRVSALFPAIRNEIEQYRSIEYDYALTEE